MNQLRRAFLTGLVVLLPLGVTLWLVFFLIDKVGTPTSRFFLQFVHIPIENEWLLKGLSTLIVIILIMGLGIISKYFFGRLMITWTEAIVERLPVISVIYRTVKQVVTTFSEQKRAVFQETVLVEYPRKGVFVLGFLTGEAKGEVQYRTHADLLNIFVPTTPNPTSGFLLMVPKHEVIFLEMKIAEGMKMIVSGGAVVPPFLPGDAPPQMVKIQNPEASPDPGQES